MKITVTVKLGAARTMVHYHSTDHFVVSMTETRESPLMHHHLQRLLARHFDVEPEAVQILSGHHSMVKVVEVEGGKLPDHHYQHRVY